MKQNHRSISTLLVATALTLLSASDSGAQRAKRNTNALNADGSYVPAEGTYEELSAEEISQGKILPIGTVLQMDLTRGRGGKYTGQIEIIRSKRASGRDLWRFVSLIVRPEMFEFVTNEIEGVSYSFTGRFTRSGNLGRQAAIAKNEELVNALQGTLMRIEKGEKVWEKFIRFTYFSTKE